MSPENIEVIRRAFEAVDRGDLDGMATALSPEFEYVTTGTVVDLHGTNAGEQGFRAFLDSFWEDFDEPRVEIRRLIDAGETVVTLVTFGGRGTQSRVETSFDLWHVWTLQNGRVVRGEGFRSGEEAVKAAGATLGP